MHDEPQQPRAIADRACSDAATLWSGRRASRAVPDPADPIASTRDAYSRWLIVDFSTSSSAYQCARACMISPFADADPVPLAVAILNAKLLMVFMNNDGV